MNIWKLNIFEYELLKPFLLPECLLNNLQFYFQNISMCHYYFCNVEQIKAASILAQERKKRPSERW